MKRMMTPGNEHEVDRLAMRHADDQVWTMESYRR